MKHHGYPNGLCKTRRGDDIYDGLDDSCRKGEPLGKYQRKEVSTILRVQVALGNLEIQRRNDFVDFVSITMVNICSGSRLGPRTGITHGFSRTASYTAQMFSSTNCTNKGFNERPLRCL